jgi:hypothetical protein
MRDRKPPQNQHEADLRLGGSIRRATQAALAMGCPTAIEITVDGRIVAVALVLPGTVSRPLLEELGDVWARSGPDPNQN